ncbi:response regulator transcription factor [Bradyrhizobium sp.]|uniref:response regulator transcription factor n=1 Tax=Bradyrhizobium sp. TaxID=376 RepID=UPI002D6F8623|nr:response regulator [Bradyrhizobium sp.]HZR77025.1 response regulator [Bradyrhizobium sp.]
MLAQDLQALFGGTKVLVVDDEYYTRKVIRTLLTAIGVNSIFDADNGPAGLQAIRSMLPDVVLVDWEMPAMDGASFVRAVRSPASFPHPNVPIIMLTCHSERWRVEEAMRLGVNEYLLKPVSSKTLLDRMLSVLTKPRPIVKVGKYYGPEPRPGCSYKPVNEASLGEIHLIRD